MDSRFVIPYYTAQIIYYYYYCLVYFLFAGLSQVVWTHCGSCWLLLLLVIIFICWSISGCFGRTVGVVGYYYYCLVYFLFAGLSQVVWTSTLLSRERGSCVSVMHLTFLLSRL